MSGVVRETEAGFEENRFFTNDISHPPIVILMFPISYSKYSFQEFKKVTH